MLCQTCIELPAGIEGHRDLKPALFRESGEERPFSVFVCAPCGAMWRRTYKSTGNFIWTRADLPTVSAEDLG